MLSTGWLLVWRYAPNVYSKEIPGIEWHGVAKFSGQWRVEGNFGFHWLSQSRPDSFVLPDVLTLCIWSTRGCQGVIKISILQEHQMWKCEDFWRLFRCNELELWAFEIISWRNLDWIYTGALNGICGTILYVMVEIHSWHTENQGSNPPDFLHTVTVWTCYRVTYLAGIKNKTFLLHNLKVY